MLGTRAQLEELAIHYGVGLTFYDVKGRRYDASDPALLAVLRSLGAELGPSDDVATALAARKRDIVSQVVEPVIPVWGDREHAGVLRLPVHQMSTRWKAEITTEDGRKIESEGDVHGLPFVDEWNVDGTTYIRKRFHFGERLPDGYHQLRLETAAGTHEALIIAAPVRAYAPEREKLWGVFAPTYALKTHTDRGVGTLAELRKLWEHVRELGGDFVGTLPLTATFLDEPFEPSPYAPVSRLFFNELFMDIAALPELEANPDVQALLASVEFTSGVEALREARMVDYRQHATLLEQILRPLARTAFENGPPSALVAWLEANPRTTDYARFRAATKKRGVWSTWDDVENISDADVDREEVEYHQYVQWRMSEQMTKLGTKSEDGGGLYLDLPLGVHPDGYDAWRERAVFLDGLSTGAPPDELFVGGQDWGFRPLDPEASRESGYRYVIDCFRHQLGTAGALRIDHVMGLERIYCVPHGLGAKEGVYVHHRAEELYAILTLESSRSQTMIVGEDLGTVSDDVRAAMTRHGFLRMYVVQFAFSDDDTAALAPAPRDAVASVNTHDTPTFTSYWEGHEIETRLELGHVSREEAEIDQERRRAVRAAVKSYLLSRDSVDKADATTREVLSALLYEIAKSDARLVLVNLEDLFLERAAQNVPGTTTEHPNWRKRIALALEDAFADDRVRGILERVDRARRFG